MEVSTLPLFCSYFLDIPNIMGERMARDKLMDGKRFEVCMHAITKGHHNVGFRSPANHMECSRDIVFSCLLIVIFLSVFKLQNVSGGLNEDCIKAMPREEWKCLFAPVSLYLQ